MTDPNEKLPLVVDASSTPLHLGIPHVDGWVKIIQDSGQAMDGLFRAVKLLFEDRTDSLKDVGEIYFCCGPGSTLALRLAAAFVKTMIWESGGKISLFQYNALDMASSLPELSAEFLQAPFRMGRRFVRSGKPATIGKKDILDEEDAIQQYPDSQHLPGQRKIAVELPEEKILKYDLKKIKGLQTLSKISEPADNPVPYSPEPPTFKKWDGLIPAKQK
jgi:tRNA A37 threonylcarbamoyladenosine modification protein TsaB